MHNFHVLCHVKLKVGELEEDPDQRSQTAEGICC